MRILKLYIVFCIITFFTFSCATAPENASHFTEQGNHIALGFWHGAILPFSAIGKLLGLNIGLYDAGKDMLSYWFGYLIALAIYIRVLFFLLNVFWQGKKQQQ